MQKALEKQSTGLDQVYQSTLQRIDMQPVARRELARRFIGWVVFAKRRLKIDEVIHAFAVESDEDDIEEDNFVSPDLLLRSCVGLVVLHDDKTVAMVHATAYDFFGSTVLLPHDMETDIAETCLRYMCLSPFREGPCTSRVEMSRRFHEMLFLDYASRNWARHLNEIENVEEDLSSLVQFFISNEKLLNAAVQALHFRNELETDLLDSLFDSIPQNQTALHVAAYWNLAGTLRTLIESGLSTSLADTHGWTALHYSCANSHFSSADVLVRSGADVDATDDQDWTPLFWASFTGSLDIVRLLLSAHAKYTKRSKYGWTALHWAISRGQTEVVLELVQHHQTQLARVTKADIRTLSVDDVRQLNTPGINSPMKIAAESKNALIFDLLVAHFQEPGSTEEEDFQRLWSRERFKVPVAQSTWRNTLKSEINPDTSGTRKSISRGIFRKVKENPNSYFEDVLIKKHPSTWKSTLLVSAIQDADFQASKLFIELGADVHFLSEEGSLLNVAAHQRDPRFVQVLLEKGAKGLQTEIGESALHTAINLGNLETAKVILDSGQCHVDDWYHGQTPLHAAANQQDPQFALLLLSKGAQPDLLDEDNQTALAIAVRNRFVETAQAVIDGGADVNQLSWMEIFDTCGWRNCLAMAVFLAGKHNMKRGNTDQGTAMVRMLLLKGADLGFQDEEGRTMLHVAAMGCSPKCIELLMAAGFKIDTVDKSGRTPIQALLESVHRGYNVEQVEETLRLLLRGLSEGAVISLLSQQTCQSTVWEYEEGEEDIQDTPLASTLKRRAWGIAHLLMGLGAHLPPSPSLRPTLMEAARDLECQIVETLIGSGVSPGDSSVLDLVKSIDNRLFAESSSLLSSPRKKITPSHIKLLFYQARAKAALPTKQLKEIAQASQKILTSLVSGGADVNFYDSEANTTPILLAAEKIPIALVTATLLEVGADCFHSFGNRLDPILTAAAANNIDSLRCLMAHVSTSPKPGHWTQHLEYHGQLVNKEIFNCICLALKRAGQLDYKHANDQTLLHIAAERGNIDLVTSLISHGAYADIPDGDGCFPIHSAAFSLYDSGHGDRLHWPRYHDIVEHLLPVNMAQHTSDHHPYRSVDTRATLEDAEVCQEISNIVNEKGSTMLWGALENMNNTMFLHLLKLEKDLNYCATLSGKHPSLLYHVSARGMTEAVSFLLECNVDVEKADSCGWRPLHVASEWNQVAVVERLIAAGASVCASTTRYHEESYTGSELDGEEWNGHSLHLAVMGGNVDIVELLLRHGADVNANTGCFKWSDGRIRGPTALHIALDPQAWYPRDDEDYEDYREDYNEDYHEDYLKIARMLVDKGASVEGVLDQLQVNDIPSFEGFEDVWDRIRGV
jgi:ankyrin repeat protein